jgi:hypothetical protein
MVSATSAREKFLQLQMQQQLLKSFSSSADEQRLLEQVKNIRPPL